MGRANARSMHGHRFAQPPVSCVHGRTTNAQENVAAPRKRARNEDQLNRKMQIGAAATLRREIVRERVELGVRYLGLAEEWHDRNAGPHERLRELRHEIRALLEQCRFRSFV